MYQLLRILVYIFTMAKILSINVQGMNDPVKRAEIFRLLLSDFHDLYCLQETHCGVDTVDLWQLEWPGISFWQRGTSHSKGVSILLHPNSNVTASDLNTDFDSRIISLNVQSQNSNFRLINIYAPNTKDRDECELFFSSLDEYIDSTLPTVLCGDFNMVENIYLDRDGGNPREKHTWGLHALNIIKTQFSLYDVWRIREPTKKEFTWHSPNLRIRSRLDRFYLTNDLLNLVSYTAFSPCSWSDHSFVHIHFDLPDSTPRGPGYWKFNSKLLADDAYCTLINNFISDWRLQKHEFPTLSLWWDVGKIKIRTLTINYATRKNSERKKFRSELVHSIRTAWAAPIPDLSLLQQLKRELRDFDQIKAQSLYVQTKLEAMEHGEKPTKYFYNTLKQQQQRHTLSQVYLTDKSGKVTVSSSPRDILAEATNFYDTLYTRDESVSEHDHSILFDLLPKLVPNDLRAQLNEPITLAELNTALYSMENGKSPGSDGLSYEFYKEFWPTLKDDFLQLSNDVLNNDRLLSPSQRRAYITLLHKDGDKKDLKNWRPISLLCTDYKIIAKMIATRITKVLSSVIHEDQTCSVPGRSLHSNLLLTRDLIQYTHQKQIDGYIITVDQEKAFDRVDRDLLFKLIKFLGFGDTILSWIQILYTDVQSSVYLNGFVAESFTTSRGLRQGCPLSAILFVVFSELLGALVRSDPKLIGIGLPGTSQNALISQYADDTTFYLSNRCNIDNLFKTLTTYEHLTGAKFKPNKTKGLCFAMTDVPITQTPIAWQNNVGLKILGITFFSDLYHTTNYNWRILLDELKIYLQNSKARDLSFRGKTLHLNSVALARLWYAASILTFPPWYFKEINKMIFSYLWGEGKAEMIKRHTLFLPKHQGGLGLFNPVKRSVALRCKHLSLLKLSPQPLKWTYLARYFIGFHIAPLCEHWNYMRSNLYPHPALSTFPIFYQDVLRIFQTVDFTKIEWTTSYFYDTQHPLSKDPPDSAHRWNRIRHLTYNWSDLFKLIFFTFAPGKFQTLHYKFIHHGLPTRTKIVRWKGGNFNPNCLYCRSLKHFVPEDLVHLFFECEYAYRIWREVKKILALLLPNNQIHSFLLTFAIFPSGVTWPIKKVVLTLIQISLYRIWLNHNIYTNDSSFLPLDDSISYIQYQFRVLVYQMYRSFVKAGTIHKFRNTYVPHQKLFSLGSRAQLLFQFPK